MLHVQTAVQVVEAALLEILVKKWVAINLSVDSVVAHNIRIKFQTLTAIIVLGISAVACAWIRHVYVAHLNVLHWISSV